MKPNVEILSCILTRRCNLHCYYCRIGGCVDYQEKPSEYPSKKEFSKNEKNAGWWKELIKRFYLHNPKIFIIFIGGEPFLYPGLSNLIEYANKIGINYTIISNSTKELKSIREDFFKDVGKIKGYTASIDPGFERLSKGHDIYSLKKSSEGFNVLIDLMEQDLIEDPVAELTATSKTIHYVENTIKLLDSYGIWSDLTVVDTAKSPYYDFSNITDKNILVQPTNEVFKIFIRLIQSDYKIHMKDLLLPAIFNILPADNDCDSCCNSRHNMTIDSDGSVRLCYRIRGVNGPKFSGLDFLDTHGRISKTTNNVQNALSADKKNLCQGCAWTCSIMSQFDEKDIITHGEYDE